MVVLVRGRAWKGLRYPGRIAIGAVVSTALALANLAYSQIYVPYNRIPLVESTAEFRTASLSDDGSTLYLPVRLTVKNAGEVPVYVLGSIYWVHGRAAKDSKYKLISSNAFIGPPGRALSPGEEYSGDEVVKIKDPDKSGYEAVKAQAEVYIVRKDRLVITGDYEGSKSYAGTLKQQGKDKDPQGPPTDYYRYQAEVSNSNEILNMTRGRQRVTMWWVYRGSYPFLYVDVAPPGERMAYDPNHPDANREVSERYGLTRVRGSMAQIPYVEVMHTAKGE
jgi:hypothetical protein